MKHWLILHATIPTSGWNAKKEAADIVKSAVKTAEMRSDDIIEDAKNTAKNLLDKANKEIEQEKKNAVNEIKTDISTLAVDIAKKVIKKDIIIDNMGGQNE